MEKELLLGILIGVASAKLLDMINAALALTQRKRREIQFDKEQLVDWRKFIIQHSFEGAGRAAAANYLKRQWNNEQRPYKHQDVRSAFPVEKLVDPNSDL